MTDNVERKRIEQHAAPEALAQMLLEAVGEQHVLAEEVAWLARVLRRRLRQVRNNEWPKPLAVVPEADGD